MAEHHRLRDDLDGPVIGGNKRHRAGVDSDRLLVPANDLDAATIHLEAGAAAERKALELFCETAGKTSEIGCLAVHAQAQDEYKSRELINRINDYRAANGLARIPVSRSMNLVASAHVADLQSLRPGNMHSWLISSRWRGGNYDPDNRDTWPILWDKPRELTVYPDQRLTVTPAWESTRFDLIGLGTTIVNQTGRRMRFSIAGGPTEVTFEMNNKESKRPPV